MKTTLRGLDRWSVGSKLSLVTLLLVGLVFGSFTWALSAASSRMLQERETAHIAAQTKSLIDMIDMFDQDVKAETGRFAQLLQTSFDGKFTVDTGAMVDVAGKQTPILRHGGAAINLDFSIPDRFTERTGATATVFVKTGDDLVRVSTSVKKENGERAVGTLLDHTHPAYPLLMSGASYTGMATLFGIQYMTKYDPIKDNEGRVIGALYVGLNVMDNIAALKEKIRTLKIGETGYFFALDAKPGKDYGKLMVAREREGDNLLALTDPQGRAFIKEMLDTKQGMISYPWQDKNQAAAAEKVVAYAYTPSLGWVIAGGAYTDEITGEARGLRNRYAGIALLAVLLISGMLYLIIKRTIGAPLAQATAAAQRLAAGDLTATLNVVRRDEIGLLMQAVDGVSKGLGSVVAEVRAGTDRISVASLEIAAGNADLSARTESQASSLEQTAGSMEQLTSAVKQNAGSAAQANQLASVASQQAVAGGAAVSRVIDTMNVIARSSGKIGDIIGVIDGIAFQTNILALNAAVEAARAGEQGRGFAVVAAEVRALAQRSAAAAREIKELVDNSVAQVNAGSQLVDHAGVTIGQVVDSIKQVADIMSEITSAGTEQSTGIEEVNRAMTQMDEITQQNAALVEQAAAAAASLQEQAHALSQSVGIFKLH